MRRLGLDNRVKLTGSDVIVISTAVSAVTSEFIDNVRYSDSIWGSTTGFASRASLSFGGQRGGGGKGDGSDERNHSGLGEEHDCGVSSILGEKFVEEMLTIERLEKSWTRWEFGSVEVLK